MAQLGTQNAPKMEPQTPLQSSFFHLGGKPESEQQYNGFACFFMSGETPGKPIFVKKLCSKAKRFPSVFWNTFLITIAQLNSNLTPTWAQNGAQKGRIFFAAGAPPKITKNLRNHPNGAPGLQNGPTGLPHHKNHDSDLPKSGKSYCKTPHNGMVAGHARSALEIYKKTSCLCVYRKGKFYFAHRCRLGSACT